MHRAANLMGHTFLTTRKAYNFGRVCLSASQVITFESVDVFAHLVYNMGQVRRPM